MVHVEIEQMVRYLAGETDEDESFAVQTHLGECRDCLARLRGVQLLRKDFDGVWEQWTAREHARHLRGVEEAGIAPGETVVPGHGPVEATSSSEPAPQARRSHKEPGSWTRFFRSLLDQLSPPRLAWAGIAAAAVVGGLGYLLLRPAAGVRLADAGGTVRVLADGRIRLPGGMVLGDAWQDRLAPWMRGQSTELDDGLARRLGALRSEMVRLGTSERPAPTPLGPVGVVVRSGPVTFRWQGVEGATNYTLLVSDATRALVERATGGSTNAVLSPTDAPVAAGGEYEWQVAAMANGELFTCSPVRFAVLDAVSAGALVMAGLYLQYGLLDDAAARLDELRRSNPDNPVVARLERLLAAARGRGR